MFNSTTNKILVLTHLVRTFHAFSTNMRAGKCTPLLGIAKMVVERILCSSRQCLCDVINMSYDWIHVLLRQSDDFFLIRYCTVSKSPLILSSDRARSMILGWNMLMIALYFSRALVIMIDYVVAA